MADLLRKVIGSYRQLPVLLYQIQTKFRDEPRARGGLIRAREFMMNDAYSAHAGRSRILMRFIRRCWRHTSAIFTRAGCRCCAVQSDVGMMGGSGAHEFMFAERCRRRPDRDL